MSDPDPQDLARAIVDGDAAGASRLARAAVERGGDLMVAIQAFGDGIRRVGDLWEEGEYFLPELVSGAEAMKAAMAVIGPALAARGAGRATRGRVVIGTVEGDLHDIGKGLVATLLAAHGFEVHDLGSGVPVATYVAKAREVGADIVAASALLTTTMEAQRRLADALRSSGLCPMPGLLIGGAPTSAAWAAEIGATHAENAMGAVAAAERLLW